jgi:hypothetical protein
MLWWVIRWLAGAADRPTLNGHPPEQIPGKPAEVLYRAAQEVKSIAFDESGNIVDYSAMRRSDSYAKLRELTGALRLCQLEELGDQADRLAFWINLYNALILDSIVCYKVKGRIPLTLFQRAAYNVCGMRFSADEMEHGVLRGNRPHPVLRLRTFRGDDPRQPAVISEPDPRIHFALNCGARSCPPIAFYRGDRINDQLELASRGFLQTGGAVVSADHGSLKLSRIFRWYQSDFGGRRGVLHFVADRWPDEAESALIRSDGLRLEYLPYDWYVNSLGRPEAT